MNLQFLFSFPRCSIPNLYQRSDFNNLGQDLNLFESIKLGFGIGLRVIIDNASRTPFDYLDVVSNGRLILIVYKKVPNDSFLIKA